jgi:hypothetical protein
MRIKLKRGGIAQDTAQYSRSARSAASKRAAAQWQVERDMLTAEVDRLTGRAEGVEALLAKTLAERAG